MRAIFLPDAVKTALENGAALAVSISGGKDSHALLAACCAAYQAQGWTGPLFAVHADLGRMEWFNTPAFVEQLVERYQVPLVIVKREDGRDLLDIMRERAAKLAGTGKPWAPSSAARYCTSGEKRDQIDRHLRTFTQVVSAEGIRSDESAARAKKTPCQVRARITTKERHALTWFPLFDWSAADVWEAIGTSQEELELRRAAFRAGYETDALDGWVGHPAYVMGNDRLSCAICCLASKADRENGAKWNPGLAFALAELEQETGFTYVQGSTIKDLYLGGAR